jgi:hypothetical protein
MADLKRNEVSERTPSSVPLFRWVLNTPYFLNNFGLFQGVNNFLMRTTNFFIGIIPGQRSFSNTNYVESTVRLTRYRNLEDKSL